MLQASHFFSLLFRFYSGNQSHNIIIEVSKNMTFNDNYYERNFKSRSFQIYIPAFPDIVRCNFTNVRQLRDRIPVVDKFNRNDGKNRAALAAGKSIAIRRHTRDRGGNAVRLWYANDRWVCGTATSSRPLLLLNISAMGRDRVGWLPEGAKGTGHLRLYYLLRYSRRESGNERLSSTCGAGQDPPLPFPFPRPPDSPSASLHIIHTTKFELYIR